jgi:hypothetical protein
VPSIRAPTWRSRRRLSIDIVGETVAARRREGDDRPAHEAAARPALAGDLVAVRVEVRTVSPAGEARATGPMRRRTFAFISFGPFPTICSRECRPARRPDRSAPQNLPRGAAIFVRPDFHVVTPAGLPLAVGSGAACQWLANRDVDRRQVGTHEHGEKANQSAWVFQNSPDDPAATIDCNPLAPPS